MHIKHSAYQAKMWYCSDQAFPNIPLPIGEGWEKQNEELQWTSGNLLTQELLEVLVMEPDTEDPEAELATNADSPELDNLFMQSLLMTNDPPYDGL